MERFKLIAVVYMMLIKDNKILLSLRKNTGYADGQYGLVSGHLDGNEPATMGLAREVKEEIGVDVRPEDMTLKVTMHGYDPGREAMDLFFMADRWSGEIRNMEPEKCGDLSFFPLNLLPDNTVPYVRDAIMSALKGVSYLEDGWDMCSQNKATL